MELPGVLNTLFGRKTEDKESDADTAASEQSLDEAQVLKAFETGDMQAAQEFYQDGLDVNQNDGALLAAAALNGHLDLLKAACEEMGGVLNAGQCEKPAFSVGLNADVKDYINDRLNFEANNNIEYTPRKSFLRKTKGTQP